MTRMRRGGSDLATASLLDRLERLENALLREVQGLAALADRHEVLILRTGVLSSGLALLALRFLGRRVLGSSSRDDVGLDVRLLVLRLRHTGTDMSGRCFSSK